jgi:hypothetical protein
VTLTNSQLLLHNKYLFLSFSSTPLILFELQDKISKAPSKQYQQHCCWRIHTIRLGKMADDESPPPPDDGNNEGSKRVSFAVEDAEDENWVSLNASGADAAAKEDGDEEANGGDAKEDGGGVIAGGSALCVVVCGFSF